MNGVGEMIGQGNTAEIYNYGSDCVLKLYRAAMPATVCEDEFRYTLLAYEATSKAPKPIKTIAIDGRAGAVYEKIRGKTMLRKMMAKIWKSRYYARRLADYHIDIQKPVCGEIPTVKEKLRRDIESTSVLSGDEKQLIYNILHRLPDGDTLCHFDFHPDNIMLFDAQYCVLDWMTACKGDKLSDVARTGIILKFSQIPRVPAIVNVVVGAIQNKVYRNYIHRYFAQTGEKVEDVEKWELPIAAARLREWIPEKEKQKLLAFIRKQLGDLPSA